jgi:hypothetical protein
VDPFASTDKSYIQMKTLLNIAGEELVQLHPWHFLQKTHSITTVVPGDDGDYDLPTNYQRMVNQTHWESTNQRPLGGPLTPQQWQSLTNADVSSTIDVSFRLRAGGFSIFPQPPENGLQISFEYISRNWVIDSTDGTTEISQCVLGGDTPLFDRTLLSRMLKVKWLDAKNLDSTKAQADLNQTFALLTESDKGAPILNAAGGGGRMRMLGYGNYPETGYGS